MNKLTADVCVIGGGYAGLMAARTITEAGRSVVLLEARDRVGGRVWTRSGPDDTNVDMGGAWLGPGQDSVRGLLSEFGVATYPTYEDGESRSSSTGTRCDFAAVPLVRFVVALTVYQLGTRRPAPLPLSNATAYWSADGFSGKHVEAFHE